MYGTSLLSIPGKFEPILLSSVSKNEVKELIKKFGFSKNVLGTEVRGSIYRSMWKLRVAVVPDKSQKV